MNADEAVCGIGSGDKMKLFERLLHFDFDEVACSLLFEASSRYSSPTFGRITKNSRNVLEMSRRKS
jgi:hypothetical protein